MIPTYENNLLESLTTEEDFTPKKVHKIDWDNNRLLSQTIKSNEAVDQNIKVVVSIEYQEHQVMPDWFGLAMKDKYGMPLNFVKANMEDLIKEALSYYMVLKRLSNFKIEEIDKYSLGVSFDVELENGETFPEYLEVSINV